MAFAQAGLPTLSVPAPDEDTEMMSDAGMSTAASYQDLDFDMLGSTADEIDYMLEDPAYDAENVEHADHTEYIVSVIDTEPVENDEVIEDVDVTDPTTTEPADPAGFAEHAAPAELSDELPYEQENGVSVFDYEYNTAIAHQTAPYEQEGNVSVDDKKLASSHAVPGDVVQELSDDLAHADDGDGDNLTFDIEGDEAHDDTTFVPASQEPAEIHNDGLSEDKPTTHDQAEELSEEAFDPASVDNTGDLEGNAPNEASTQLPSSDDSVDAKPINQPPENSSEAPSNVATDHVEESITYDETADPVSTAEVTEQNLEIIDHSTTNSAQQEQTPPPETIQALQSSNESQPNEHKDTNPTAELQEYLDHYPAEDEDERHDKYEDYNTAEPLDGSIDAFTQEEPTAEEDVAAGNDEERANKPAIPTVILHIEELADLSLFPPSTEYPSLDQYKEYDTVIPDHSIAYKKLDTFFASLKQQMRHQIPEKVSDEDELGLSIPQLGLEIYEDSVHCSTCTFEDISALFHTLDFNDGAKEHQPLHVYVIIRAKFSTRLNALHRAAKEQKGLSTIDFIEEHWSSAENFEGGSSYEEGAGTDDTNNVEAYGAEEEAYLNADGAYPNDHVGDPKGYSPEVYYEEENWDAGEEVDHEDETAPTAEDVSTGSTTIQGDEDTIDWNDDEPEEEPQPAVSALDVTEADAEPPPSPSSQKRSRESEEPADEQDIKRVRTY